MECLQTSQSDSFDMARERSSEEILYPLGSLYPHVVALQLQADENPWTQANNFSGYHDISYWAEVSSSQGPAEDYSRPRPSTSRRYSGMFHLYLFLFRCEFTCQIG